MLKRIGAIVAAVAVACLAAVVPPLASAQGASSGAPEKTSLIIKLAPGLSDHDKAALVTRNGGTQGKSIPALGLIVIEVPAQAADKIKEKYGSDPQVQRVEENRTRHAGQVREPTVVPTDPLFASQWSLPIIWWDLPFGMIPASGTAKVAILDTGIDAAHEDLAANVQPGTSILDGTDGRTDPSGHGTTLAGIVAAQTNTTPGVGIAGVGYVGVQLLPVTVLDSTGQGQDADVIAGVMWAADNGADVILMGFSNPGFSQSLQDAIDYAWGKGVVLVAAVGNDAADTPTFPAGDRGVMGVSATDQSDLIASFSNEGQAVFIAAPGVDVQTTLAGGGYGLTSGTSASAAIVAGAAAMLKAADPTLTNGVIVGRLARTADPAGDPTDPTLAQAQVGNGRVNLGHAMVDTGTDSIEPAGADPVGAGGPFVGPYVAAATNTNTAVTRTSGVTPSTYGDSLTFTATVTNQAGGAAITAGNVEFRDGSTNCGNGTVVQAGAALNGSGQVTFTTTTLSGGAHTIRACYLGSGSGGSAINKSDGFILQTVNPAATTTTITSDTPDPSVVGQSYAVDFSVTAATGTPTGNVTVSDGTASCVGTVAAGTCNLPSTTPGIKTLTATYASDGNFSGSSAPTASHTVNKADTTTAITSDTPDPSINGQAYLVTYTVTATAPGSGTPTGNVTVSDGSATCVGTVAAGQCSLTSTGQGAKTLTATYASDTNFNGSTSAGVPHQVNLAAPTLTAPGTQTTDEGTSATITLGSFADPDGGPWSVDVDWGDASSHTTFAAAAVGSLGTKTHTYADGINPSTSYTVMVTVTDTAAVPAGSVVGSATFTVKVNNVKPDVTAPAGQTASAGVSQAFNLGSFSDPGVNDSLWSVDVDWGDGSPHATFTTAAQGSLGTSTHAYAAGGPYTVVVKVTDKDGPPAGVANFTVTIADTAPVVTAPADQNANEGASTSFALGSFTDPDGGPWSVDVDWGDASVHTTLPGFTPAGSLGSQNHTYADNGVYTVIVKVTDSTARFDSKTFQVTVANMNPTATFSATSPINEGSSSTLTLSAPVDPSSADTTAGFKYSFACDGLVGSLAATYAAAGATNTTTCPFANEGSNTVKGRIFDKDNGYTDYSATVVVNNAAPNIATNNATVTVNEGSSAGNSGTWSDAGLLDVVSLSASVGSVIKSGTNASGTWTWSYATSDGPAQSQTVTITANDGTTSSSTTFSLVVNNVAPTATFGATSLIDEGTSSTLTLSSPSDPSAVDTAATFHYSFACDGTTLAASYAAAGTSSSTTCFFGQDGVYTVKGRIFDKDNGYTDYAATVTVNNVAPVVSIDIASQSNIQYSDGIAPVTVSAVDVLADLLTASSRFSADGGVTFNSGLPAGLGLTQGTCTTNGDGIHQTCTWTLSGHMNVPAGTYVVRIAVKDDYATPAFNTATTNIVVIAENAAIAFDGGNPTAVQVAAAGGASGSFALKFVVNEPSADAGLNPLAGDIGLAQGSIQLVPVGPGSNVSPSAPCTASISSVPPPPSYLATKTYTCNFTGVPVNTYTVAATVNGGYYADYEEDVLTVYDPSLGFTTGGGWFYWPGSDGPGYPGDRTNFGYTMKYNKSMTNLQGSLLAIRHKPDGTLHRLKSNSLGGLSIGQVGGATPYGWASFSGGGNYLEPPWTDAVGNYSFIVYVEDRNQPGTGVDRFWIQVKDKNGSVVPWLSIPVVGGTGPLDARTINGGNIVAPHAAK